MHLCTGIKAHSESGYLWLPIRKKSLWTGVLHQSLLCLVLFDIFISTFPGSMQQIYCSLLWIQNTWAKPGKNGEEKGCISFISPQNLKAMTADAKFNLYL